MPNSHPFKEIRILHITESAHGGVGTYLNEIVPTLIEQSRMQRRSLETRVMLPSADIHMIKNVPKENVKGYKRRGRSIRSLLSLLSSSLNEVLRFKPHIVHLHSTLSGAVLRIPLWIIRIATGFPRVVYSPHGWAFQMTMSKLKKKIVILIELVLSRITTRIITLSLSETRECIELGFSPSKLVRVYNGVSENGADPLPAQWEDDRVKVLFVGRFDRQKGLDILFEAVRPCSNVIAVRCAGSSVVNDAVLPDLPSNVELLGWLNPAQLRGHLRSADVVVVPSRWEGFGLVAAEAMRESKMVIASDIGGLPEVVSHGRTGRLVPPGDATALRAALLQDTPRERELMGEAGRQRFLANFTSSSSTQHLLDLYYSIIGRKSVAEEA